MNTGCIQAMKDNGLFADYQAWVSEQQLLSEQAIDTPIRGVPSVGQVVRYDAHYAVEYGTVIHAGKSQWVLQVEKFNHHRGRYSAVYLMENGWQKASAQTLRDLMQADDAAFALAQGAMEADINGN
jgi:hypothetical protein